MLTIWAMIMPFVLVRKFPLLCLTSILYIIVSVKPVTHLAILATVQELVIVYRAIPPNIDTFDQMVGIPIAKSAVMDTILSSLAMMATEWMEMDAVQRVTLSQISIVQEGQRLPKTHAEAATPHA